MIRVGIVGASGYSGEVLVELLSSHPGVELAAVTSRSLAGKPVAEVFPRLSHRLGSLQFTESDASALAQNDGLDAVFLALPHGVAAGFARPLFEAGKTVFDLSADFRLGSPDVYKEFYGQDHPDPELLKAAAYVLPEFPLKGWQEKPLIACPGCYPTSILIPLLPLLASGTIQSKDIIASCMSGVSGAGKKANEDFSYCERTESARPYGQPKHRHLSEIEEQLASAAGSPVILQFLPHLVPMRRGIVTTISVPDNGKTAEDVLVAWKSQYANRPFVRILEDGTLPESKNVVGTNRIDIAVRHDARMQRLILTSTEDNLLKGASGQAVQLMNLKFGLEETIGLP
ncbi:N-acetyl-gamma-glutamyl-phosphate reductase [Puniceicoccus vermicola]|uniref:N-acetyl-gamma-glutamyl-phosphate reductase n=1 Tax=Puniceicoccus vermicola TaxID=388746 RepID=A0A7X1E482_9BACT|nr:N-acetyl-gamma-glutamyl-phosphate reductase [Puniceicoccus vermicola]MBC2601851.1 N-acetyl-gamma-glutamyl-phosphate reductase [Puniceicoccus vermicola]